MGTGALPGIEAFGGRQRAFVKVQDGCDAFCSYCIVPHVRPRVWSRPPGRVLAEARRLVAAGHREIVLCGVCLGAYGQATTHRRRWTRTDALAELLAQVARLDGLWRVRLSSLAAPDVTDELLGVLAGHAAVAPHLHLSLQSGSAQVLRRMNRPYSPDDFLDAVGRLRRAVDSPAVTTDVIVGFPGEGEGDFDDTLQLARRVSFSRIHVFPFSPRKGTAAWKWRAQAPPTQEIRRRCKRLAAVADSSAGRFGEGFVGSTVEVLVERPNRSTPAGCARGLTDRYLEVAFPPPERTRPQALAGRVLPVRITGVTASGLTGRLA